MSVGKNLLRRQCTFQKCSGKKQGNEKGYSETLAKLEIGYPFPSRRKLELQTSESIGCELRPLCEEMQAEQRASERKKVGGKAGKWVSRVVFKIAGKEAI